MSIRNTLFFLALVIPGLTLAQEQTQEDESAEPVQAEAPGVDPPGRVARLSFIRGDVTFQAADRQAPEQAVINRPLTSGDRVMTGPDSRSELTLGLAALRLHERSDLSIANLDDDIAQFEVNSGTVGVHLREIEDKQAVEIDTPNAAIRLLEPGDYRVDVEADGTALLSVRRGKAEIDAGNGATQVREGEQARLGRDERTAEVHDLGRPDEFDDWADERERQLNGQETRRYVSSEVVGYEDLDTYGDWRTEAEYGPVWYPRVAVGWSPYSLGSWSWVGPWGWTWIDTAPWGFAPFHYGRWAHIRSRWCWVPGPRHYRPFYAPALVGWVGNPYGGVSVSVSRPIGWFPLGPREVYVPYRHYSPRYLRRVNVANTVIVNNSYLTNVARNRVTNIHYANRNIPGATITRPRHEFDANRPPAYREWNTNNRPAYRDIRAFNRPDGDARGRVFTVPGDRNNWNGRNSIGGSNSWGGGDVRIDRGTNRSSGSDRTPPPLYRSVPPSRDLDRASARNDARINDRDQRWQDRTSDGQRDRSFGRDFGSERNTGRSNEERKFIPRSTTQPPREWQRDNRVNRVEVPRQERGTSSGRDYSRNPGFRAYGMPDARTGIAPDRLSRPAPGYTERRSVPMPERPRAAPPQVSRPRVESGRAMIQGQPQFSGRSGGRDHGNRR